MNLEEIEALEDLQWFIEVSKLKSGDTFGELALLNDKPRAATITCITDCHFAILGK
jgi:CRP-like cAMP-binding protein